MKGARWRIASIALLALVIAWQAWPITIRPNREGNPERPGNSPREIITPETPDERIADWTEALAVFTAVLVIVSATQIWFLIRADKTAKTTADAAKQSAEVAERALEQTSAPYLDVVLSLKDAVIHRLPGGRVVVDLMGSDFAEYVIHNYGNSPAIVLEIYQGCIASRAIPETITFPPPQSNLKKVIVVGGMKESHPVVAPRPAGGIPDVDASETVWIILQIRYRDVFMNQYLSASCFAYNKLRATFSAEGGAKYNNRRKLTDEELKIAEARDAM